MNKNLSQDVQYSFALNYILLNIQCFNKAVIKEEQDSWSLHYDISNIINLFKSQFDMELHNWKEDMEIFMGIKKDESIIMKNIISDKDTLEIKEQLNQNQKREKKIFEFNITNVCKKINSQSVSMAAAFVQTKGSDKHHEFSVSVENWLSTFHLELIAF